MTSVLAGAFSGVVGRRRESTSPHGVFVRTQLLPSVTRLQKEVRVRKYKVSE